MFNYLLLINYYGSSNKTNNTELLSNDFADRLVFLF